MYTAQLNFTIDIIVSYKFQISQISKNYKLNSRIDKANKKLSKYMKEFSSQNKKLAKSLKDQNSTNLSQIEILGVQSKLNKPMSDRYPMN